ncbi:MAG: amidohydrolase family protein [Dehalococcoidia bacterium]|nr:amidohydrolase family protein [Dehalococcoidia bacterium]
MIIDAHTHVFPPRMIERRGRLVLADAGFAELYGEAKARMVSADALIESMDRAGVDASVICGFWWRSPDHAEEHAAYLLDAAAASGGRLIPFVPVVGSGAALDATLERLVRFGARGLGEVRPGQAEGVDAALERAASAYGLPAVVHSSETVGHRYAGKHGGYEVGDLWRLLEERPGVRVIASHWGGGLPFFALMPELRAHIEAGRLAFDTAASAYLYEPRVFEAVIALAGLDSILWGSDFPLRAQAQDRAEAEAALPDDRAREAVLGGNAARFLGLTPD